MIDADLVIVGAGFAGTMVAVNALRAARRPLRIALFDRRGAFARGAAYASGNDEHLLNLPAAGMGAFAGDPGEFARWLRARGLAVRDDAFVARRLYGDYLTGLLVSAARDGAAVAALTADVADLRRGEGGWTAFDAAGEPLARAPGAVLALGSREPSDPAPALAALHGDPRYAHDPWEFARHPVFDARGDVLVVGTSLTALDAILSFERSAHPGKLYALSRHGRWPLPHEPNVAGRPFLDGLPAPRSAAALVALVRCEVRAAGAAGEDWRAVVEGLRPHSSRLWEALGGRERRRFLRHVRPLWEIHRTRAPAASLAAVDRAIAGGRVVVLRGTVGGVRARPGALEVRVRERPSGVERTLAVAQIVNCTGPAPGYAGVALLDAMTARGDAAFDPLGMGIDALPDGRVRGASGEVRPGLWTLGWPLRGTVYEANAVREIRVQAEAVARAAVAEFEPAAS